MTLLFQLPKRLRLLLFIIAFEMLIFTALRIAFWMTFHATDSPIPLDDLLKAFFIGFKFDLRLALLLSLPIVCLSWIPAIDPVRSQKGIWLWVGYLLAVMLLVTLFYIADFGQYAYLQRRVDATILRYLENPMISLRMVWETYPVLGWILGLTIFTFFYVIVVKRLISKTIAGDVIPLAKWKRVLLISLSILLYAFGIYGKLSHYPLRWSEAFFTTHRVCSALALNPVLYFFDTQKSSGEEYDEEEVRKYYDIIASYLGVTKPDQEKLNFSRDINPTGLISGNPNIVIIILESFAAHKLGCFGNPLNPSPNFDAIAKDSLFFRRLYVPCAGTARAVFATLIGTPDIIVHHTSSRNPIIVKQHTIVNAFRGYEKMYFIGGSANWGNIRGVLSHNIPGLRIYEEGHYSSPRIDVWGISDLNLFEEANRVLRNEEKPFFAIIHTSGNHRPYSIPEDNRNFKMVSADEGEVKKYGFVSLAELNSFRFMDHSIGIFMRAAVKEKYFGNTLFVFLADHGLVGTAPHMPKTEEMFRLTHFHIPFLIYGPGLIPEGETFDIIASQVDVLPTLAAITGTPYKNTTIGRNLLDTRFDSQRQAFILSERRAVPEIGLLSEGFYFIMDSDGTNKRLYEYDPETPGVNASQYFPDQAREMEQLCRGIYQTSKYLLYHN